MDAALPVVDRELLMSEADRLAISFSAQPLIARGLQTKGHTETLTSRDVMYLDTTATPPGAAYQNYIQSPFDAMKYKSTYDVNSEGNRELVSTSITISRLGGIGVVQLVKFSGAYTIEHSAPQADSDVEADIPEEISEDEAISILEDLYIHGSRDPDFLFHNGADDLIQKIENLASSITIERQALLYDLTSQVDSPLHAELYEQLYSELNHGDNNQLVRSLAVVSRMFKLHAERPLLSGKASSAYRFLNIGEETFVKLSAAIDTDELTDQQKAAYYADFIAANQEDNIDTLTTIIEEGLENASNPASSMVRLG